MRLLMALVLLVSSAWAAEPGAKPFLESIYKAYAGNDSKGVDLEKPGTDRTLEDVVK